MLQKRAIRVINKSIYNSHSDPLFNRSGILKRNDLYEYQVTLFMVNLINTRLSISFNLTFQFNHQIQNMPITRQSNFLSTSRCYSNFARKLPLSKFPHNIWKKRPSIIIDNSFRTQSPHHIKICFLIADHSHVICTSA